MITEDYVSFEVAKLLKEKGFDEPLYTCYKDGKFTITDLLCKYEFDVDLCRWSDNQYAAPTPQMTMKWLREVYNLHIEAFIGISDDESYTFWTYFITDLKGNMIFNAYGEDINFQGENYEQTVDAAIKYCLINLI